MNTKQPVTPDDHETRGAMDAIQRAAELARTTAIQTDTAIIIVKDGKRVRVTADELRQQRTPTAP